MSQSSGWTTRTGADFNFLGHCPARLRHGDRDRVRVHIETDKLYSLHDRLLSEFENCSSVDVHHGLLGHAVELALGKWPDRRPADR